MSFQTLAFLTNIVIACGLGFAALRRRRLPGAISLGVLSFVVAIWSACYLFYDNRAPRFDHQWLAAAIYFSSTIVATSYFTFTLSYTGRQLWIRRRTIGWLAVMPLVTQVLFWVRPGQDILFGDTSNQAANVVFFSGPWAKVIAFYIYILTGASVLLLLDAIVGRSRSIFSRSGILLLGSVFPPAVQTLSLARLSGFAQIELLPFAFTLAGLGFAYGLFQQRTADSVVDRDAVVEGMDDGWMVLNTQKVIVDMNSAAERMTGRTRKEMYGQPITTVLGDLPYPGPASNGSQQLEMKRSLRSEEGWSYLDVRISPLTDQDHKSFGHLAVWRDMTERKLSEEARQRGRNEMFVLLNAISSAASSNLKLEDFLLEAIYHIIYPFRSQVIGFFLMDERNKKSEDQRLYLASHLGMPAKSIEELATVSAATPLFESVIKSRQPLQINDAENDPRVPAAVGKLGITCLLTLPLIAPTREDGKVLGCMCIARKERPVFSQDEVIRLSTLSDQIANLIDSDRRRKLAIVSSERQRLMRDLHDSVSQKLYGLVTTTEAAQAAIEAGTPEDPGQVLSRIGENARQAVKEMRLFLFQMQPIDLEKDGLISLLHHRLAAVEGRADIQARLLSDLADEEIALPKDKQIALYYIAQEALNNVLRHARAKSILVTLKQGRQNVTLEIRDDGHGFDLRKVERGGLGLSSMRERTTQINGKLKINSKIDEGTEIVITVRKDPDFKPTKRRR